MQVTEVPFLTRGELAARWGMSPRTLENWATQGKGPVGRRFGLRVMYRLCDVMEYERRVFGGAA
ncbi:MULTISPECIES: helix-turn-helix transcriptional regulator [Mycobacteroides]|uniref:DNA-binding protein n=1 Tax=Mycobacteroides immunogenum TaxID=83262 RepID=A0A7V8LLG6_9MYCO|nr:MULTISPECIES: helix-turn-helix domain-containing protein [Mycobacteroides]AMT72195.1 hypothetical protein ABG82_19765 [Mycobacteroides immunogenum]ANO05330.1 hypothetical protein BAB75_20025 [Mycobacteroides immunogenum]KIU40292.1 hypothetical protein TL11_11835 [Mycobacteroides immunogenum]KPG05732.1 hypothetical protein AN908_21785 [Mycobacteroides immunogenum]KPG12588.1 hypothetical protein AN909_07315 [Mycobacteroides immunogenum]